MVVAAFVVVVVVAGASVVVVVVGSEAEAAALVVDEVAFVVDVLVVVVAFVDGLATVDEWAVVSKAMRTPSPLAAAAEATPTVATICRTCLEARSRRNDVR